MRCRRELVTASSEASSSVLAGVPSSVRAASVRTARSSPAMVSATPGSPSAAGPSRHSLERVAWRYSPNARWIGSDSTPGLVAAHASRAAAAASPATVSWAAFR